MKLKDVVLAIIALMLALFFINLVWAMTMYFIKIIIVLVIAYALFLLLKQWW